MMPVATLQAAMSKALAHLKRTTPAELLKGGAGSADGTSALDSIEVIWLLAKMKRAFGHSVLDLSNVPRSQWSTLGAVSALVHDAIAEMP
ncbi:hypothetical protein [Leifsonia sp. AK011]|uniref:hypothetical protein n=1 Tax=Leifsonia sp. AK011 TaxID=2723075 RepID=UPI0015CCE0F7|nr:hypothetical protein [Leifsonia sp. AK011]